MFVVSWKFEKNVVGADGLIYNGLNINHFIRIIIINNLVTVLFLTTAIFPILIGIVDGPYWVRKKLREIERKKGKRSLIT